MPHQHYICRHTSCNTPIGGNQSENQPMKITNMQKFICCFALLITLCLAQSGMAQAYPDRHTTSQRDGWISCSTSTTPNATRGNTHWIMYDLGTTYALQRSTLWNLNTPNYLDAGAQDIMIDYSINGNDWTEWGRYSLEQGNGSSRYEGQDGPDFAGITARYVLITITSNYGNACSGIAEFRVAVTPVTISNDVSLDLQLEITPMPNPFTNSLDVKIEGELKKGMRYQLVDGSGKLVLDGPLTSKLLTLQTNDLSSGQYVLSIVHTTGVKSVTVSKIQ